MILQKHSDTTGNNSNSDINSDLCPKGPEGNVKEQYKSCPKCGANIEKTGQVVLRHPYPFPAGIQALFGLSFVAFLFFMERLKARPLVLWVWSGIQILLGILLAWLRIRAKKTILRCIRCGQALG